jgi:putative transposase
LGLPAIISSLETGAEVMKASGFSDAQKALILKRGGDGVPAPEIRRKAGTGHAMHFNWKNVLTGSSYK